MYLTVSEPINNHPKISYFINSKCNVLLNLSMKSVLLQTQHGDVF